MAGLQIVEQMRRFMHDDVVVGISGFVGGPPHMREVVRDAVTWHFDFLGCESVIAETNPKNVPCRRVSPDVAARQFGLQGCGGSLKIQHERARGELAERSLLPAARHESLHHSPKTALNVLRCHLGLQPRFCWNQFTQPTKQHPQRDFDRSAVSFVHLELGRGKTTRTRSLPSPLTGVQEPLNNRRQQTILCGPTGRFSNAPFDRCEFIVFRCCRSHSALVSLPTRDNSIINCWPRLGRMKTLMSAVRSRLFKAVRERPPDCPAVESLGLFSYTLDHGNPVGDHAQEIRRKRRALSSGGTARGVG